MKRVTLGTDESMATDPSPITWSDDVRSGCLLETSATAPGEIAAARHAAAAHLERCGCTNIDHAVLVLSELVTNAILHAGGADRIVVACDDSAIHINVHDHGREPALPRHDNPAVGGRGLHIVARLTDRWGSSPSGDGKDVWATLPRVLIDAPLASGA